MNPLSLLEMGVYAALTAVFLGAGAYGLWLILGPSVPSISLGGFLVPVLFVVAVVAVLLLGAMASPGEEE